MIPQFDLPAAEPRSVFASPAAYAPDGSDGYSEGGLLLDDFRPQHVKAAVRTRVRYCLYGDTGRPVVAVLGGISAARHVLDSADGKHRGWWPAIVGRGLGIDLNCYRVLSLDYFTGLDCETGGCDAVSTVDQAQLLAAVLDALDVARLRACVGASYGAMVALAFAAEHPARLERVVAISGAHQAHPMAKAFRSLQRRVVRLGMKHGAGVEALQIARALGLATYRSHEDYARRFAGGPVEDFLLARARGYATRIAPEAFLRLSESLDTHSVDPRCIRVPTTLLAADPDLLVPVEQMRDLARQLGGWARLIEIPSRYGHDAFLKEHTSINALLASTLAEGCRHD